ncbi:hypothetical protein CES85_3023 (plasmid) [Ochrobactrum quorumnocens]|uniref:Uncharacterized protein n=1 Tax=Ochrobactrum quorumnocens TaxID=271865 RepID=A0A248UNW9_9HYPH|nr:hypothetical protein CES85_3023 [[Ochrobactrum] quorumnocens]
MESHLIGPRRHAECLGISPDWLSYAAASRIDLALYSS